MPAMGARIKGCSSWNGPSWMGEGFTFILLNLYPILWILATQFPQSP